MNKQYVGKTYDAEPKQYKEIWNAAIEAAANLVNTELGTEPMNHYHFEREIRKLKK